MGRRLFVALVVVGLLAFASLAFLGKRILPEASLAQAWQVPFGTPGYLSALRVLIPAGSDQDRVVEILGEPTSEFSEGGSLKGFSFGCPNPHQRPDGEIMVRFGGNGGVISISGDTQ